MIFSCRQFCRNRQQMPKIGAKLVSVHVSDNRVVCIIKDAIWEKRQCRSISLLVCVWLWNVVCRPDRVVMCTQQQLVGTSDCHVVWEKHWSNNFENHVVCPHSPALAEQFHKLVDLKAQTSISLSVCLMSWGANDCPVCLQRGWWLHVCEFCLLFLFPVPLCHHQFLHP